MLYDPNWKPPRITVKPEPVHLTPRERKYLLKVLSYLKDGKIKDFHNGARRQHGKEMFFNMGTCYSTTYNPATMVSCGTAGCVGGWMTMLYEMDQGNLNPNFYDAKWQIMHVKKFKPLFYPPGWMMEKADTQDGIRAIENFLRGAKRPWNFMYRKYAS